MNAAPAGAAGASNPGRGAFWRPLRAWDWRTLVGIYGGCALLVLYAYQGNHRFFDEHLASRFQAPEPLLQWCSHCYQFGAALVLLGLLPAAWWVLGAGRSLRECGLALGDWRFGLKVVLAGLVLLPLPLYLNAGSPTFQQEYPLARMAGDSVGLFLLWELCYLCYYVAWEFFFRGFWQLGLSRATGPAVALAIQTVASTVMHLGKPEAETLSAIVGGVVFGLVAARTRSVLYVILLHWYVGMGTDLFCLLRSA